jgi:hypothetical protein
LGGHRCASGPRVVRYCWLEARRILIVSPPKSNSADVLLLQYARVIARFIHHMSPRPSLTDGLGAVPICTTLCSELCNAPGPCICFMIYRIASASQHSFANLLDLWTFCLGFESDLEDKSHDLGAYKRDWRLSSPKRCNSGWRRERVSLPPLCARAVHAVASFPQASMSDW